jgi:hypothetical protein
MDEVWGRVETLRREIPEMRKTVERLREVFLLYKYSTTRHCGSGGDSRN